MARLASFIFIFDIGAYPLPLPSEAGQDSREPFPLKNWDSKGKWYYELLPSHRGGVGTKNKQKTTGQPGHMVSICFTRWSSMMVVCCGHMATIYHDHTWWSKVASCMLITCRDHIWGSYMMILHGHHTCPLFDHGTLVGQSQMVTTHDNRMQWSYRMATFYDHIWS